MEHATTVKNSSTSRLRDLGLQAHDVNCAAALDEGRLRPLDVAAMLSMLMVNGVLDQARVLKLGTDLILDAAKAATGTHHPRVAACGECAPTLWAQGNADAAIQLEHSWDEIARRYDVDILCGYVLRRSQFEHESHIYRKICAEHSAAYSR